MSCGSADLKRPASAASTHQASAVRVDPGGSLWGTRLAARYAAVEIHSPTEHFEQTQAKGSQEALGIDSTSRPCESIERAVNGLPKYGIGRVLWRCPAYPRQRFSCGSESLQVLGEAAPGSGNLRAPERVEFASRPLIHLNAQRVHGLKRACESLLTAACTTGERRDFSGCISEEMHNQIGVAVVDSTEQQRAYFHRGR